MKNNLYNVIKEDFRFYLFEATAQPAKHRRILNTPESITYEFIVADMKYEFNLTQKTEGFEPGTYEAVFIKDGQKGSSERGGVGARATLIILSTCKAIMDKECKEKKIRYFNVEGAIDEASKKTIKRGDTDDNTQRARIYEMFFTNQYSKEAVQRKGRFIKIDMTKVFPEVFDEGSNITKLTQLLNKVNDVNSDKNVILNSIEGNEDKFSISTDEIQNSKYGGVDLDIFIDNLKKQYEVEYNKYDVGQGDKQEFDEFDSMVNYLQKNLT